MDKKEMFATKIPEAEDCKTCKYAMKDVVVRGKKIERYAFAVCDKYSIKPSGVLWNGEKCKEKEEK